MAVNSCGNGEKKRAREGEPFHSDRTHTHWDLRGVCFFSSNWYRNDKRRASGWVYSSQHPSRLLVPLQSTSSKNVAKNSVTAGNENYKAVGDEGSEGKE